MGQTYHVGCTDHYAVDDEIHVAPVGRRFIPILYNLFIPTGAQWILSIHSTTRLGVLEAPTSFQTNPSPFWSDVLYNTMPPVANIHIYSLYIYICTQYVHMSKRQTKGVHTLNLPLRVLRDPKFTLPSWRARLSAQTEG